MGDEGETRKIQLGIVPESIKVITLILTPISSTSILSSPTGPRDDFNTFAIA